VPHDGIASPDRRHAYAFCSDYALRGFGRRWDRFGRLLFLARVSGPFSRRVAVRDGAAWGASADTGSLAAAVAREGSAPGSAGRLGPVPTVAAFQAEEFIRGDGFENTSPWQGPEEGAKTRQVS
jgi:hypothetical protein